LLDVGTPSRIVVATALALIAVGIGVSRGFGSQMNRTGHATLPLLVASDSISPGRGMPAKVVARLEAQERAALARARDHVHDPRTQAGGCVATRFPGTLGPPLPQITARLLGRHVALVIHYRTRPASAHCRPATLLVAVRSSATPSGVPWVREFPVEPPSAGRLELSVPPYSPGPYRLIARSVSMFGDPGPELDVHLACNGRCVPPLHTGADYDALPKPLLPLIAITRAQLEASFRFAVSRERDPRPAQVACASSSRCVVSYVDASFPHSPYRVAYLVEGEPVAGCWMARLDGSGVLDPLPYSDARKGETDLAACRSWGSIPAAP
jgi:hypothetical protein